MHKLSGHFLGWKGSAVRVTIGVYFLREGKRWLSVATA